ncbi:MAG: sulfur carrier protein ThiS [Deltaproteobacteria bacterium]|jgi:sulfur carrier protein|nr:sulfur carrier protein ThiS [Deltaproteobacteria bacterium]
MKIIVSGTTKEYSDNLTIKELITLEKVQTPEYVTVALNGAFVESGDFLSVSLKEGDEVEFLYFMGGGSGV